MSRNLERCIARIGKRDDTFCIGLFSDSHCRIADHICDVAVFFLGLYFFNRLVAAHIEFIFLDIAYDFSHVFNHIHRIFPHRSFTRKHHCICTIQHRISHIIHLCTSWRQATDHGFHHLCSDDYRSGVISCCFY